MDLEVGNSGELGTAMAQLKIDDAVKIEHSFSPSWICAICLEKIKVDEIAQVKGCEHAYCSNCILRWASYNDNPWCPQCKFPFSSLLVCRSLDGRMSDYMVEESVCLLLRCNWFSPLPRPVEQHEEVEEFYQDDDELYEEYYTSSVRLGNRRWGDSGYVRGGRKEARPVSVRHVSAGEGSSVSKGGKGKEREKEAEKENVGRRAKRAQKRLEEEKLKQQK